MPRVRQRTLPIPSGSSVSTVDMVSDRQAAAGERPRERCAVAPRRRFAVLVILALVAVGPRAVGDVKDAPPPPGPWTAALAGAGPEPTTLDLFRPLKRRQINDKSELETWFTPVPGTDSKLGGSQIDLDVQSMTGVFRLVPPLREGTALRLNVQNPSGMRIVAWAGTRGAVIEVSQVSEEIDANTGPRWCGSVLTRPAQDKPIDGRWLVSTSDGRGRRTGAGWLPGWVEFNGVLELRYCDNALVLSRGEVRFVEVPLPAAPDEVRFEGTVAMAGIELVRAVAPLPLPAALPATTQWRPADLTWSGSGAAALEKRPDGGVRLAQPDGAKAPLMATWKLPPAKAGPREVVLKIDDYTPGTGIVLAGPPPNPTVVCGFVEPTPGGPPERRGNRFMIWSPDKSPLTGGDPKALGLAFAPRSLWLRLNLYDATLLVSWSDDGRRWARLRGVPPYYRTGGDAAIAEVGLFVGGHPGRSITVSQIAVAEMPGFARILPRDLLPALNGKLVSVTDAKAFGTWVQATLAAKPADVAERTWLAAAAIRCLGTNCTGLTGPLCQLAWEHARSLDLTPAERLDVCDDINRLTLGINQHMPAYAGIYATVARDCLDRGDVAGYRAAWLRLQQAPSDIAHMGRFHEQLDPLAVRDRAAWRLFAAGNAELQAELARQAFYDGATSLAAAMQRQLEAGSPLTLPRENRLSTAAEGFAAALDAAAWEDAHRVVGGLVPTVGLDVALHGLCPDPRDPDRLATMPLLVAEALREHREFAEFMLQQPAARGALRLAHCRAADDVPGMTVAAFEFAGTPAAAEAREWLAERAIAAGRFSAAVAHVQAGLDDAPAAVRDRLLAIRSLAQGVAGDPVTVPPPGGVAAVPATEIAAVVAASAAASLPPAAVAATTPAPGQIEALKRLDLGPGDKGPVAAPYPGSTGHPIGRPWDGRFVSFFGAPFMLHRLDWGAEVCAITPGPGRVFVGNRLELVALDPATGAVQWRAAAGPKAGNLGSVGLVPMRPVWDAQRVFTRRLAIGGKPTIAALQLADGAVAWETPEAAAGFWVSDPVLSGGMLWACEVVSSGLSDALALVALDPATGRRCGERWLATLENAWQPAQGYLGDCQLVAAEGRLLVATSGCVLGCDADGQPLWMRRQPWLAPQSNGWWWHQARAAPLVHDGGLFIVQPGTQAVSAIDAASGRLRWRVPVPLAKRLVGLAGRGDAARLVVETGESVVAIDPRDGATRTILDGRDGPGDAWLGVAPLRLLHASLVTADGRAVVAVHQRRPAAANSPALDVALLWIDVATGEVDHTEVLPPLAGGPPWVGPLAAADGKLWLLSQTNPADLRRQLWEVAAKPAP
jgi:outer membrane protein assembly factor BamB